jgi:hypothetical protein
MDAITRLTRRIESERNCIIFCLTHKGELLRATGWTRARWRDLTRNLQQGELDLQPAPVKPPDPIPIDRHPRREHLKQLVAQHVKITYLEE